jgi:hypothetical protein
MLHEKKYLQHDRQAENETEKIDSRVARMPAQVAKRGLQVVA